MTITDKDLAAAAAALDDLAPQGREHGTPPPALMPEVLRPLAQNVHDTKALLQSAGERHSELKNVLLPAADADYKTAIRDAKTKGRNPIDVPDPRPALRDELGRAESVIEQLSADLRAAWIALVRATVEHRDEARALPLALAQAAQDDVVQAQAALVAARRRLDAAIGLDQWIVGLRPSGNVDGVSTTQGPHVLISNKITWKYRGTTVHLQLSTFHQGLTTFARGYDSYCAELEYQGAKARREAGDRAALAAPVPSKALQLQ